MLILYEKPHAKDQGKYATGFYAVTCLGIFQLSQSRGVETRQFFFVTVPMFLSLLKRASLLTVKGILLTRLVVSRNMCRFLAASFTTMMISFSSQ